MFADVEGANVVGYMNKDTEAGSSLVVTPVFQSMKNTEKFYISELKLTGYQEAYEGEEMFDQLLTLTKMDPLGYSMDSLVLFGDEAFSLAWFDEIVEGEWVGGHWVDVYGKQDVTPEHDFEFAFGEGLVVSTPDQVDEEVLQIVSAGQVSPIDSCYELPMGSSCVIGNPMPTTVCASDVTIDGYQEAYEGEEMFDQLLTLTKMDPLGYSMDSLVLFGDEAFSLAWFDEIVEGEWVGGHWVDVYGKQDVSKEHDFPFLAGEGLVLSTPDPIDEEVLTISFASPIAKHDAE